MMDKAEAFCVHIVIGSFHHVHDATRVHFAEGATGVQ